MAVGGAQRMGRRFSFGARMFYLGRAIVIQFDEKRALLMRGVRRRDRPKESSLRNPERTRTARVVEVNAVLRAPM